MCTDSRLHTLGNARVPRSQVQVVLDGRSRSDCAVLAVEDPDITNAPWGDKGHT